MHPNDCGVEHLDQLSRMAQARERFEERLEDLRLAQPVKALPNGMPRAEPFRQGPPSDVLDGEEMHRSEEPPIIRRLATAPWKARPKTPQA